MLINDNGTTREMTEKEEEGYKAPKTKPNVYVEQKAEAFDYLTGRSVADD
jgi:hypothetical protein